MTRRDAPLAPASTTPATPVAGHAVVLDRVERGLGERGAAARRSARGPRATAATPARPAPRRRRLGQVVAQLGGQVGVLDVAGLVGRRRSAPRCGGCARPAGAAGASAARSAAGVGAGGRHAERGAVRGSTRPTIDRARRAWPSPPGTSVRSRTHPHARPSASTTGRRRPPSSRGAAAVRRQAERRVVPWAARASTGTTPARSSCGARRGRPHGREHLGPLGQPGGDGRPGLAAAITSGITSSRHGRSVVLGVRRGGSDAGALGHHQPVGGPLAPVQLAGADGGDGVEDAAPAGPRPSLGVDGQVVPAAVAAARAAGARSPGTGSAGRAGRRSVGSRSRSLSRRPRRRRPPAVRTARGPEPATAGLRSTCVSDPLSSPRQPLVCDCDDPAPGRRGAGRSAAAAAGSRWPSPRSWTAATATCTSSSPSCRLVERGRRHAVEGAGRAARGGGAAAAAAAASARTPSTSPRQWRDRAGEVGVAQQEVDGRRGPSTGRPAAAVVGLQARQRAQHRGPLHLVVARTRAVVVAGAASSRATARTSSTRLVMSARSTCRPRRSKW